MTKAARAPSRHGRRRAGGLPATGIALGVGLGGFLDGIVLHQLLQWHHMISAAEGYAPTTLDGLEANTRWDGAFHVMTYLFVLAGLILLWRRRRNEAETGSWREGLGWALVGWGAFNVVEGFISHHLLEIHHVRPGPNQLAYDLGFLGFGAALVGTGWLLARRSHRRA
jgi:uncharacterized membrane protein